MRMRKKKWAQPELDACPYFIADCDRYRGQWRTLFPKAQPLHIELIWEFEPLILAGQDSPIAAIDRLSEAEGQKSASRAADEAAEWIRINSARRLTAADAAAHAGYHPDYLSALFKAAYSLTLKQYIARERMKLIRSQLLTTADSLRTIARRLDFDGEEQLIHYFRYHEGLSPTQYRNLYDHTHLNKA